MVPRPQTGEAGEGGILVHVLESDIPSYTQRLPAGCLWTGHPIAMTQFPHLYN